MSLDPGNHWRWVVNGFAGMVGMCIALDADGPAMTGEQLQKFEEYLARLRQIADSQRQRLPGDGQVSQDSVSPTTSPSAS